MAARFPRSLAWILLSCLLCACQPIQDTRQATPLSESAAPVMEAGGISHSITVHRGETYTVDLDDVNEQLVNQQLRFYLVPLPYGWEIQVMDAQQPAAEQVDYSWVATPPYRTLNARQVEGWHFRNADNTGPNAPGPGNVNAPQHVREFCYATDRDAYEWAYTHFYESAPVSPESTQPTLLGATLTITELTLVNLQPGTQAWIESMQAELQYGPHIPCRLLP